MSNKKKSLTVWLVLEILLIMLLILTIQFERYVLAVVVALKLTFVSFRYYHIRRLLESYSLFRDFKHLPDEGTFEGQSPVLFESEKRPTGVLLIHGFSSTPQEFGVLTDFLKNEGIPYYTPVLTGFGIDDVHLLETIKETDWLRDAVNAYDIFSSNCEKVVVVGHSMGGVLACHIASKRRVDKLVLTAPYLISKKKHDFGKSLLIDSPFGWLLKLFNPYVQKSKRPQTFSEHYPKPRFAYDVVPVNSIKALWYLQEKVAYENIYAGETLVITGGKDNTVENERVYELLESKKIIFTKIELSQSGHLVFESPQALEAAKRILEFIKS